MGSGIHETVTSYEIKKWSWLFPSHTQEHGFKPQAFELQTPFQISFFFFWRFYSFLERGEEREKEREWNINVWLPLTHPLLGTWPATQACALTGNQTGDALVHRPALNPLSHTSQGLHLRFKTYVNFLLLDLVLFNLQLNNSGNWWRQRLDCKVYMCSLKLSKFFLKA